MDFMSMGCWLVEWFALYRAMPPTAFLFHCLALALAGLDSMFHISPGNGARRLPLRLIFRIEIHVLD